MSHVERRERWSTAAAAALVLPSVVFVSANILKYGLGVGFVADALGPFTDPSPGPVDALVSGLVLLGPVAALAVALPRVMQLRFGHNGGAVEATVRLRLRWPLVVVATGSLVMLAMLGGYLVLENGACWFGSASAC